MPPNGYDDDRTMSEDFQIIEVAEDAPHAFEQMGTKPKFWYLRNEVYFLFKEGRPGTGEDWAEKVAEQLAALLQMPHAEYELAVFRNKRGTISQSFLPPDANFSPGNQLLGLLEPSYPRGPGRYRRSQHTLGKVTSVIDLCHENAPFVHLPVGFTGLEGVASAIGVFVGYLMFDCWICNTDRHDENWGWVLVPSPPNALRAHLVPTFDHASSLGSHERDDEKSDRLTTKDRGRSVMKYVEKARSAIYLKESDRKPLTTLEAFRLACADNPTAGKAWLRKLSDVSLEAVYNVLSRVPRERMTPKSVEFAAKILELNRTRLLQLQEHLP